MVPYTLPRTFDEVNSSPDDNDDIDRYIYMVSSI